MNILYLTDAIPPASTGGSGKRIYALCEELARQGHALTLVTTVERRADVSDERRGGIRIISLYSRYHRGLRAYVSVHNPRVVRAVEKIIADVRPDAVHFDNIHTHISYAAIRAAKRTGCKTYVTLRDAMAVAYGKMYPKIPVCGLTDFRRSWLDNFKQARKRFNPLRNFCIRRSLRGADAVIAVSGALKNILEQNGIRVDEVIHDGIEIEPPALSSGERAAAAHRYGLEGKKIVFLPGRLNYAKGVYAAVDSFAEVVRRVPGALLLFVGAAPDEQEKMRAYAAEAGAAEHVRMLGWTDGARLAALYELSSVVISPSLCFDMFPGVNLEAALYGKPVVTGCFGGAKEFVVDGKTGFIINPYKTGELTDALIKLLTDAGMSQRFGQAAYERLAADFSIARIAQSVLAQYAKR